MKQARPIWLPAATDAEPPNCPMLDNGKHHGEMVFKSGRFGEFWGCSRYPDCTFTIAAQKWDQQEASRLGYGNDEEMVRCDR